MCMGRLSVSPRSSEINNRSEKLRFRAPGRANFREVILQLQHRANQDKLY